MKLLLRSLLFILFAITLTSVNVFSQSATIATDQPDYAPGSTAIITGSGFTPGETVTLQVLHDPTGGDDATDPSHQPFTTVADANGNVSSSWYVPSDADELGATLKLTAVGQSSGLQAAAVFTDAIGFSNESLSAQASPTTYGSSVTADFTYTFKVTGAGSGAVTYNINCSGFPAGVTYSPTSVSLSGNGNQSVTVKLTTGAATAGSTITVSVSSGSKNSAPENQTLIIGKATANITVTPYHVTYNGNAHTATGTATGVETPTGTDLSSLLTLTGTSHTNAADYPADAWNFAGNSNYNSASGTVHDIIDQAPSVTKVTINGAPFTYTGLAQTPATVSVTGAGALSLTPTALYSNNVNAGTATASYTFVGDANHTGSSDSKTFAIGKADPAVTVTGYSVTYDGNPHTATYTITGVNGETGATVGTINVSATTHTNAGTYNVDAWSFTGAANYNNTGGSVNDNIDKAPSTTVVTINGGPFTYTGLAQTPATVSVTGAGALSLTPTASYSNNVNAGTATASYTFAGDANHTGSSDSKTFAIGKADPAVTVTGYSVTYDGNPHTATYTITGVNGETGATVGTIDVSATTHTNAGTYNADAWSFAGAANYNNTSGSVNDAIAKANPAVVVTGYSVTYDGNPHTATYTITGVNGESGATVGTINVSATTHTNAGTYNADAWSFAGAANYNSTSGSVNDAIAKANPAVTVTGYSVTYDGNPHTATYSNITGVNGEAGATVGTIDVTGTTHTNAGTYNNDPWTFTGTANYNNTSGSVNDAINQKAASVTPDAAYKYCGQVDPSLSGTLNGFLPSDNVTATYSRTAGEIAGGSYTISATLSPATVLNNYNIAYNTAFFTINAITSIDASGSSNAWPVGSTVTLSASITPAVNGVPVTFTVTPGGTYYGTTTIINGVATATATVSGLSVGLYKVDATAGSNCATSTDAYFSVYDPNAGFVTGGGWINSPAGAYSPDPTLTGKANFGFNAQYKKGNNTPDGNTQFQFQAGNLNFKSTNYSTGSLVVAGAKAIFQGTGTINGTGNYNFMISAIDGTISGGGGVDKFRIKIWTNSNGSGVVYDNNSGSANNSDPSTALGGGSIVIHNSNSNKSRIMSSAVEVNSNQPDGQTGTGKLSVKVAPNPTSYYFTLGLQSLSKENIKLVVTDITGRVIEQRTDVPANSTIQLGSSYHPGIYIAQFLQGTDRVTIRLIKEGK